VSSWFTLGPYYRIVKMASENGGYFASSSVIRRVSRELLLMLGGGRALLMQVAHPLVAAGVVAHSGYRESPWDRLERTMSAVWTIVFGSRAEADRVAARVRSLHGKVQGQIPEQMGPFPAGTRYSAADPELMMWVHATLVDTALLVYRGWIGPLSERDQETYYQEMKVLACALGTPASVIPPTFGDFRLYMDERLESDEITVTDAAREVLDSVVRPPLPAPLRPVWEPFNLVTASLLPEKLREQYGLGWGTLRGALVLGSRQVVRRVVPFVPSALRAIPPARREGPRSNVESPTDQIASQM
jgi:uncharacterized protein (DUF2236 family)